MKIFIAYGGSEEEYVSAVFSNREAAVETYGEETRIEEYEVADKPFPKWKYWHRGADVYPDGTFDEWTQEHDSEGPIAMEPCDDHLNAREEPWDGHTQGHCGEHISIFGTDKALLEEAFQRHLREAIARQDGVCHSTWSHDKADGVRSFQEKWWGPPRLSTWRISDGATIPKK